MCEAGARRLDAEAERTCRTCAKKDARNRCRVLRENIGADRECWAWTDDPQWREKVRRAVRNYRRRKEGR